MLLYCALPFSWLCANSSSHYKKIIEQSERLYGEGDIYSSLRISENALSELRKSADTISNTYVRLLHNSSICHYKLKQYEFALNEIQRCNSIRQLILKPTDERYIHSLLVEAEILSRINRINQRDSLLNLILERTYNIPRLYYWIKAKQVYLLYKNNEFGEAIFYGVEAILNYQKQISLAKSKNEVKKYSEILSDDILDINITIANSYDKIGDFTNAIKWTNQVVEYKQNTLHMSDVDCLTEYHNLAQFYNSIGNCEIAKNYGAYVISERQKRRNAEYARTSHVLASIYAHCGKMDTAIYYAQSSLNVKEKVIGKDTYSYTQTLSNLAIYYAAIGDYSKALTHSKEAYSYLKNNKFQYAVELQHIASIYNRLDCDSAVFYRKMCANAFRVETFKALHNLTYKQRQTYIMNLQPRIRTLIWYPQNEYINSKEYNRTSYDIAILLNSACVGIENKLAEFIKHNKDSAQLAKYNKWKTMQQLSSSPVDEYRIDLFEHELLNLLQQEKNDHLTYINITHELVKHNLKQDEIGVEITYGDIDTTYIALILRKNWDAPKCVILGNEAELDSMAYPQLQQAVWQAIIDSAQIKEGENIYFAPDGIFYNMPIEYLPTADGRSMSDKYNMFRVSSTRELCYRDTANTYSTAVLYGGLRYDATPQNLFAQNSSMRGWDESIHESVFSQWRADDRAQYNYLPYTLKEVDSISQTIGNAIQVTTYTDKEGSEESFKSLSGHSPSILHIATHGYYITPTKAEMMSKENLYRYGLTAMDDRSSVIDYSMERTGLLMAGAQLKLRGDSVPQMAEDGILSAKEISHLDLSNTDLVVLSACQTALGDITNDGVAGLQRGFKIAGVKSVLMSLWKVDDAATYLLMKQFYKSLFAGKNKQQALRDAQNYLRSYMDGNEHPYNDIHYWGAFVLLDAIEK